MDDERYGALEVDVDYVVQAIDGTRPITVRAGGESAQGMARLRAGYAWNGLDTRHEVSLGVGAENESGGVEYGVMVPMDAGRVGDAVHMLSVRLYSKSNFGPPE